MIRVHPRVFSHATKSAEAIDKQMRKDTGRAIIINKGVATLDVWPPKDRPKHRRKA